MAQYNPEPHGGAGQGCPQRSCGREHQRLLGAGWAVADGVGKKPPWDGAGTEASLSSPHSNWSQNCGVQPQSLAWPHCSQGPYPGVLLAQPQTALQQDTQHYRKPQAKTFSSKATAGHNGNARRPTLTPPQPRSGASPQLSQDRTGISTRSQKRSIFSSSTTARHGFLSSRVFGVLPHA